LVGGWGLYFRRRGAGPGPGQGRAAPKLERVEFPADSGPHGRGRPEVDPFDPTSFTPNASPRNATAPPGQK
jgi:hypothetical protein